MSGNNQTSSKIFLPFLIGILIGILISRYILPKLLNLTEGVKEESIVNITNSVCPVEEVVEEEDTGCPVYVDVGGAVINPGVYCLDEKSLVVDAVKRAGGFKSDVALTYVYKYINLSKTLTTSQKVYIPSTQEVICELKDLTLKEEEVIPIQEEETTEDPETNQDPEGTCININTATAEELDSLVGIGPSTATKIIQARPFTEIEGLLNVAGIGEATLAKFKDEICI